MKINFDLKFYKLATIFLVTMLVISFFYIYTLLVKSKIEKQESYTQSYLKEKEALDKNIPETPQTNLPTVSSIAHGQNISFSSVLQKDNRVLDCWKSERTEKSGIVFYENQNASNTRYKTFYDCSFATNAYYLKDTSDYYGVYDTKEDTYYYIENTVQKLGSLYISFIIDDTIFLTHIYEGGSDPRMFLDLKQSRLCDEVYYGRKIMCIRSIDLDSVEYAGFSSLEKVNNKLISINQKNIAEINLKNFSHRILKTFTKEETISWTDGMVEGPEYKIEGNNLILNIYKNGQSFTFDGNTEGNIKPLRTEILEIK